MWNRKKILAERGFKPLLTIADMREAIREVRERGEDPYYPTDYANQVKLIFETIFAHQKPRFDLSEIQETSICPKGCKIGKMVKDHLNLRAMVDQLIAENQPQSEIINLLAGRGFAGVNPANVTRHKPHLTIPIQPKETLLVTKRDPEQHRVDSPEYVQVLVPRSIADKLRKHAPSEIVSEAIQNLQEEIKRLRAIDPDKAATIPRWHDLMIKYEAELRLWTVLLASLKDQTGNTQATWSDMMRAFEKKDKKDSGENQAK